MPPVRGKRLLHLEQVRFAGIPYVKDDPRASCSTREILAFVPLYVVDTFIFPEITDPCPQAHLFLKYHVNIHGIKVVEDMLEVRKDHFALCPKETVVVYLRFFLRSLIPQPDSLEALMKVIQSIHPCRTVVIEVEVNLNSPAFVNRFIDCLFFHGAFFDCLEACMDKETSKSMESMFFAPAIKNIVAAEGEERECRNVTVDAWKAFFSRFQMTEVDLSDVAKFRCGESCTFDSKGKSLIVGWKGTPVQSMFKFI